ncbi:hypothetical protein H0H87_008750 [Tephrocybe sp. NHM501043]|nr:hypothetical protein H0H87_008750 [Tephrocybe sp. NHM501043]
MLRQIFRALIFLSATATALYQSTEDPECAKGAYSGFETNIWQFNAPATQFINITGSFFHSEWYIGPLTSTTGEDNTIGSTRTAVIGNSSFTEQLVGHYRSPTQSVIRFSLHNGSLPLDGFDLVAYTEEINVKSICGGTATYLTMTATYCTDNVAEAYDFYDKFRRDSVGAVAKELNALVFSGTCPVPPGMRFLTPGATVDDVQAAGDDDLRTI